MDVEKHEFSVLRKDIEEVGEAVEALGVMMENELHKTNLQLNQLNKSISDLISQEKTFKEEISELRSQIHETRELGEEFEATLSRTESRISELQKIFSAESIGKDDEDHTAEIRSDLFIIKRDLQFVRSNLKEILDHREYLDKKIKDFENRIDGLEKEKFA
ncbi:MAG: coiled-coil domain-containing protein [Candidatus Zixiibacteriota bacterium]